MKTSTLVRNGVSAELVGLISRLIDLISWPVRRRAMGTDFGDAPHIYSFQCLLFVIY